MWEGLSNIETRKTLHFKVVHVLQCVLYYDVVKLHGSTLLPVCKTLRENWREDYKIDRNRTEDETRRDETTQAA